MCERVCQCGFARCIHGFAQQRSETSIASQTPHSSIPSQTWCDFYRMWYLLVEATFTHSTHTQKLQCVHVTEIEQWVRNVPLLTALAKKKENPSQWYFTAVASFVQTTSGCGTCAGKDCCKQISDIRTGLGGVWVLPFKLSRKDLQCNYSQCFLSVAEAVKPRHRASFCCSCLRWVFYGELLKSLKHTKRIV